MMQLANLGYTDYDKNYRIVKAEKKNLTINVILDKLARA